MKKDTKPLIVAVFLVTGGLLVSAFASRVPAQMTETATAHQDGAFFISTAQGAENTAALFGGQTVSAISAVSGDSVSGPKAIFFVASGAIKDPGTSVKMHFNQKSSSRGPDQTSSFSL
jgi:hypothetical protein